MLKRNQFIIAALEELQQAPNEGGEAGQDVGQVAVQNAADGEAVSTANTVTETNVDSTTDAVAELMERNTQLASENNELQAEVFDNDTDVVSEASDSVQEDLAEAVAAGAALEQLSHLADLTVKSGMANKASVAGLAFAFEQITDRVGLKSHMAALEADEGSDPETQAKTIGEKAKNLGAGIMKRLSEGIQRIIAWIKEFFKRIMTRTKKVADEARALKGSLGYLNPNVKIEDQSLINRMRLVKNGGTPIDQFVQYTKMAGPALFDFFGKEFEDRVAIIHGQIARGRSGKAHDLGLGEINDLVVASQKVIFTERASAADASSGLAHNAEVKMTPECVGGVRLYLAYESDNQNMFFKTGKAMKETEVQTEGPLPAVDKAGATQILSIIDHWMDKHREIEKRMNRIEYLGKGARVQEWSGEVVYISSFLKVFAGLATGTMGGLLTLNLNNSLNYLAYVKECIRLSGASTPAA